MEIVFKPEWRLTWYVSPLDQNPEIHDFDLWDELQDWVAGMESSVDCFDLELCIIERLET